MTDRPAERRGGPRFDPNYDKEVFISREMVDLGAEVIAYYEALGCSRDVMAREAYRAMSRLSLESPPSEND